jgi:hypothetical protein
MFSVKIGMSSGFNMYLISPANDEFSCDVGWSEAEAHAVSWNVWLPERPTDFLPTGKQAICFF